MDVAGSLETVITGPNVMARNVFGRRTAYSDNLAKRLTIFSHHLHILRTGQQSSSTVGKFDFESFLLQAALAAN